MANAMQVKALQDDSVSDEIPLVAAMVFEDDESLDPAVARADERIGGLFSRALASGDFKGRDGESALFYAPEPAEGSSRRFVFLGAGRREDADRETLRRFAARAVRAAEALRLTSVAVHLRSNLPTSAADSAQAVTEGGLLAAWDYRELKTRGVSVEVGVATPTGEGFPPLVEELVVLAAADKTETERGIRVGRAFAEGENLARTLQSRPGNVATPTHLAEVSEGLARTFGFGSHVLGPAEMKEERMEALLAVAAGSEQEPRLMVLEHHGGKAGVPPIALVGKGLTFDAGGISIKPASGMEDMKYDMSGGAAVLGAMHAIGQLDLPVNVVAVVPSSENLISGKAKKPGDIVKTRAGITVEIVNTDAEGRLILADALSYVVDRYQPGTIVDCATLTGACVIALGHEMAAVLGNDDGLIDELRAAGDRAAERCWPLPMSAPYHKQLKSDHADLKNVGGRPAGTITAACFLSEFIGGARWAHLDIAGTAYGEPRAPYHRKGGFGFPTRLLLEWILSQGE